METLEASVLSVFRARKLLIQKEKRFIRQHRQEFNAERLIDELRYCRLVFIE